MVSAGRAGDIAPGDEWLLPCFLLYRPTSDLLVPSYIHAIPAPAAVPGELLLHTKYPCTVRVKSEYAAYSLPLTGRASMQAGGYNEEGQCINAIARGKLGDLLSIEH